MINELLYDLIITNVRSAITIYSDTGSEDGWNDRPYWSVVLKFEGETVYTCNGNEYISNAENMVILPKGASYRWRCTEKGHFTVLNFDCDKICDTIMSIPIQDSDRIHKIMKRIESLRTAGSKRFNLGAMSGVYEILYMLTGNHDTYVPSSKLLKIMPSVDYINRYYYRKISNEQLGTMSGMSAVYFRKIFTEAFGVSPINYLHKVRISKAKEMLEADYGSISNIAVSLGYQDIYHFSKTFKRHTGFSPSQYAALKRTY